MQKPRLIVAWICRKLCVMLGGKLKAFAICWQALRAITARPRYELRAIGGDGKPGALLGRFDSEESAHRAAATSLIGELDYEVIER